MMRNALRIMKLASVLLLCLSCASCQALRPITSQPARRPNVIVIVVDSMGYGDSEPYGVTDIHTPNLNRMAREGVRLTDGYANGPVCTPTRAAFMTGRYQQRTGLEWFLTKDRKDAGLPASEVSIARMLKNSGYRTAMFGKWHLGYTTEFGPNAHGFEEFFGILDWSVDYFSHKEIDGSPGLYENATPVEKQGYLTDLISDRAVSYVHAQKDNPFFAYVAYNAMVSPIQSPDKPQDVRTRATWNDANRQDYVRMVERVDEGIGKIIDALERDGLSRDTLIVFTNDHGGQWYSRREPMFHGFGTIWEGGIRVPYLLRWPGHLPANRISHQAVMTMDLMPSILAATGATSNGAKLDGIDVLPILTGKSPEIDRTFFWRIDRTGRNQKAVRRGSWKLVIDNGAPLLFDVSGDPSERHDVGYQHRALAIELRGLIGAWEKELAKNPPSVVVK